MNRKYTHLSLFAGCGGIDLGFKWAGIETIAAVELKEYACDTLRYNSPSIKVFGPPQFSGDVREFSAEKLKGMIGNIEIDIISGGPPCQPFSVAAGQRFGKDDPRYKRKGDEDQEKGNLLPEYIRLINELRPKVFVIENVAALISWNDGNFLSESLKEISADYVYSKPMAVHAHLFGVPQYRERMIIIGTRVPGKTPVFSDDIISVDKEFTVDDALQGFPENPTNHQLRKHTEQAIERYKKLEYGERDHLGRVDRLDPDKPSKTVISGGDKGGGRSHLHPYLPRTTSPRECARFQTFPDDYFISGTMSRQFTQIGNAVPPLLAYFIGSYIKKFLFDAEWNIAEDLSAIRHPVVQRIPEHIRKFSPDHIRDMSEMTLFDFLREEGEKGARLAI